MTKKTQAIGFAVGLLFLAACESPYEIAVVSPQAQMEPSTNKVEDPVITSSPSPTPSSNPDPIAEAGIFGRVVDALSGSPIAGATITLKTVPFSGVTPIVRHTDSSGKYSIQPLPAGNYSIDFQAATYISVLDRPTSVQPGKLTEENLSMSKTLNQGAIRVTVTWTDYKVGAVRDIDSYLSIPNVTAPLSYPYAPIYNNNQTINYYGANIDRDDTQWKGPETITINTLSKGIYTYYINNYSNRSNMSALGNSAVQITVYSGDQVIREYKVPQGIGRTYKVFQINDGSLVDSVQYDDSLPVYSSFIEGVPTQLGPLL